MPSESKTTISDGFPNGYIRSSDLNQALREALRYAICLLETAEELPVAALPHFWKDEAENIRRIREVHDQALEVPPDVLPFCDAWSHAITKDEIERHIEWWGKLRGSLESKRQEQTP